MSDKFHEDPAVSEAYRKRYVDGVAKAVEYFRRDAEKRRAEYITPEKLAANREQFRADYARMLGIDRACEVFGRGAAQYDLIKAGEDDLCEIYNILFHIAEGVDFYGLLELPKSRKTPSPLVIFNHGGGGTPQLATDVWEPNHYGGMAREMLSRGYAIYAPQMMKWGWGAAREGFKTCTTQYNLGKFDSDLRQCGVSISGWEIYGVARALDTLLAREDLDGDRVGMMGLSYGGFFTLYTMAYDTRIKAGWSAAFFNDRFKYAWSDLVWCDSASHFFDEEVAGLSAPRRLWIDVGAQDEVFDNSAIEPYFEKAKTYFAAAGVPENLGYQRHEGGHRFSVNGKALEFFVETLK